MKTSLQGGGHMVQVMYVLYEFSHDYQSALADLRRPGTIVEATNLVRSRYEGSPNNPSERVQCARWMLATCTS